MLAITYIKIDKIVVRNVAVFFKKISNFVPHYIISYLPHRERHLTVTKIKQERTNQNNIKIGPLFDFRQHFSIFIFKIFSIN